MFLNTNTKPLDLSRIDEVRRQCCTAAVIARIDIEGLLNGGKPYHDGDNPKDYIVRMLDNYCELSRKISKIVIRLSNDVEQYRKAQPKPSNLHHIPCTMSSREIAEVTGKKHPHVMRDIREMFEKLGEDGSNFGSVYLGGNGEQRKCYILDQEHLLTLITGYNVKMRHAIIKRWRELEVGRVSEYVQPKIAQAPEAIAYEKLTKAEGALSVTYAAKQLKMKPSHLFRYLHAHNWIYRRAGDSAWHGKAYRCNVGDVTHTVYTITKDDGEERIREQLKITPQGLAKLAKEIN